MANESFWANLASNRSVRGGERAIVKYYVCSVVYVQLSCYNMHMDNDTIISKTADYIKTKMLGESTGHDWWHVHRVWRTAKTIAADEPGANVFIVELGALLHDIADWKFTDGDMEVGPKAARDWLETLDVSEEDITHVEDIIRDTSFKGAEVDLAMKTLEARIVFDADKLDAIGAIGIARTFAYGGNKGRAMYEPSQKPTMHTSFEDYASNTSPTINHFYEKLLLLKDLMQTSAGRKMAEHRHAYMEDFLQEFYEEWDGKL